METYIKDCIKQINAKIQDIPQDSYYIQARRHNKHGDLYLYVVIDNNTVKIPTTFKDIEQDYIYLKESNGSYKVSLTPFKERNAKNKEIKQGDIWIADLSTGYDSEQRGVRPVLVIQNDYLNNTSNNVVVIPHNKSK